MVENMTELQEAVKVAALVSLAHESVEQVLTTVQELAKAAKHLQTGDLHLALTIINSLQTDNELRAPPHLSCNTVSRTILTFARILLLHAATNYDPPASTVAVHRFCSCTNRE